MCHLRRTYPELLGVCGRRAACRAEYRRRQRPSKRGRRGPVPCEICGTPTRSRLAICAGNPECKREYMNRYKAGGGTARKRDYRPCAICGYPTIAQSGICKRTLACRTARDRQRLQLIGLPAPRPCDVCGAATGSIYGVCQGSTKCQAEFARRRRAANPEAERAARARRLQRADRPCRYARAGCTAFADVGYPECRPHRLAGLIRRRARRRARTLTTLAARQGWLCTWCEKPLAADLADVDIDHVIPKAAGLIIEDDWNLEALHGSCNGAKGFQVTPHAIALAGEHGITLAGYFAA